MVVGKTLRGTKAWEKIYNMYPLDGDTVHRGFLGKVHKWCEGIVSFMKNNLGLTVLFTALAIVVPIVVSYCVVNREKIDIPKSGFLCGKCWLDSPMPMYCDTCPGSPDYKCAKTKGVCKKYSTYINVNQKKVKVSDLEESAMEKTLHEARRILGETGYGQDAWSTTMNIKDVKYNIGYQ